MAPHSRFSRATAVILSLSVFVFVGCGGDGGDDSENIFTSSGLPTRVDPANLDSSLFVRNVTNPLFPLTPGATYVFGGAEQVAVEVTDRTKNISGIIATVVRDRAFENGVLVEDTEDYFAQDVDGNVWYLGEATMTVDENGNVTSTAGSFEAGVNGAEPGIQMPANPQAGQVYRQEHDAGNAEDQAENLAVAVDISTPAGNFSGCLKRRESTPLEPGKAEDKLFCPGVGLVQEEVVIDPDPEEVGKTVQLNTVLNRPFVPSDLPVSESDED